MTDHVIETNSLTKRYGKRILAVDALDLRLRRGEVFGFLGPNGAGKTTRCGCCSGWCARPRAARSSSAPAGAPAARPGRRDGRDTRPLPIPAGRDNLRVLAGSADVAPERVEAVLPRSPEDRAGDPRGPTRWA